MIPSHEIKDNVFMSYKVGPFPVLLLFPVIISCSLTKALPMRQNELFQKKRGSPAPPASAVINLTLGSFTNLDPIRMGLVRLLLNGT